MGKYQQECDYLATIARQSDEIAALRAELDALSRQKPVFFANQREIDADIFADMPCVDRKKTSFCAEPLYARPVPAIPEGYAIVPIEATKEMIEAANHAEDIWLDSPSEDVGLSVIYKAMIAAAAQEKSR